MRYFKEYVIRLEILKVLSIKAQKTVIISLNSSKISYNLSWKIDLD